MAELFHATKQNISLHIARIFKEGELDPKVVVKEYLTTTQHGAITGKTQVHAVKNYNLDVIISVGYRIKSIQGTRFRQWALNILKEYMLKGYAVNQRMLAPQTQQKLIENVNTRLTAVEQRVDFFVNTAHSAQNQRIEQLSKDVQKVMVNLVDPSTFKHFLILNGQRLEADVAYTQIYSMAKKSVLIVDDYLDVKTLDLLRCVAKDVSVKIFSEQHGRTRLTGSMLADFRAARPDVLRDAAGRDERPERNGAHSFELPRAARGHRRSGLPELRACAHPLNRWKQTHLNRWNCPIADARAAPRRSARSRW